MNVLNCMGRQRVKNSVSIWPTHCETSFVLLPPQLTIIVNSKCHARGVFNLPRVMFEHCTRIRQKSIAKLDSFTIVTAINHILITLHRWCYFFWKWKKTFICFVYYRMTTPTTHCMSCLQLLFSEFTRYNRKNPKTVLKMFSWNYTTGYSVHRYIKPSLCYVQYTTHDVVYIRRDRCVGLGRAVLHLT